MPKMLATDISYKLDFRFSVRTVTARLKFVSFHQFPTSKPVSLGRFVLKKVVIGDKMILGTKTMAELVRVSAFQNGGADEEEGLQSSLLNCWNNWGIEWALNRLSKWLVATLFGIVVLWRHDGEIMWAVLGAVLNACLSVALKRVLNQKRPFPTLKSDPGMPSSHAQSIFFAASFAILSMVMSMGLNKVTATAGVLALAFSSYLTWLRVSQRLHTISQVVVGAVLGSVCSCLWFQAWHSFVLKAFISFLWVRLTVIMGASVCCALFLVHVIKHWIMDEQTAL